PASARAPARAAATGQATGPARRTSGPAGYAHPAAAARTPRRRRRGRRPALPRRYRGLGDTADAAMRRTWAARAVRSTVAPLAKTRRAEQRHGGGAQRQRDESPDVVELDRVVLVAGELRLDQDKRRDIGEADQSAEDERPVQRLPAVPDDPESRSRRTR